MEKIEERIENINKRMAMVDDRVGEIRGEITTLDFQMELNKIDARLYRMKRKTLMYELELLDKKVGVFKTELNILAMFKELDIEVEAESLQDEEERV